MKNIRKGKDISVRWPILTNGEPTPLDGRDLTLFVKSQYNVAKQIEFTTEDNIVLFTFYGTEQQMLGGYQLTLWENYGKVGQTAVDYCDAFQLVSCTCKEGGEDEGLKTETLELESSTLEVGIGPAKGIEVVQEIGDSQSAVMSQDAVTRALASESFTREQADTDLNNKIDTTVGNINALLEQI